MNENNANKLRFSIVIPTYSADFLLMECIHSLCNQLVDKSYFEVIVVNDGGKKEISKKLEVFESQLIIRYFFQKNKGPAAARNFGINKARGDIILFLDDDSLPTSDWLRSTINAWEKYHDCDGIGGYIASEKNDSIYCSVNRDFFNWYLSYYSENDNNTFLSTCNAGYKKNALNEVGNFDEGFKKASGEDRDLNIKLLKAGAKLILCRDVLVYHDRDLTLGTFTKKYLNYGKAANKIYKRYPDIKSMSTKDYINLYLSILKKQRTCREKFMAFLLLTLSQVCTIVGYYKTILSKEEQRN
jgi:glycosyltransferase involved in cell wall biosynthesis